MEAIKEKSINSSSWSGLYDKVVNEIMTKESSADKNMKDALHTKLEKHLKGKDLILQNSCSK